MLHVGISYSFEKKKRLFIVDYIKPSSVYQVKCKLVNTVHTKYYRNSCWLIWPMQVEVVDVVSVLANVIVCSIPGCMVDASDFLCGNYIFIYIPHICLSNIWHICLIWWPFLFQGYTWQLHMKCIFICTHM